MRRAMNVETKGGECGEKWPRLHVVPPGFPCATFLPNGEGGKDSEDLKGSNVGMPLTHDIVSGSSGRL